jgi:hypothetical protein
VVAAVLSALIEGCCDSGEGLGGARERTDPVGFCVDAAGSAGTSAEVAGGDDDVDELDRVRSRTWTGGWVRLPFVDEPPFVPEGLEEIESGGRACDGVERPLELEGEETDRCWGTGGGCGALLKLDDRTAGGRFPPAPDRELRDEFADELELVLCRAYGGCAACNGGKAEGGNPAIVLGGAGDGEEEAGEPEDDVDCEPRVLLYGWNDWLLGGSDAVDPRAEDAPLVPAPFGKAIIGNALLFPTLGGICPPARNACERSGGA